MHVSITVCSAEEGQRLQAAAFMLLAAEEYVLEHISECEEPEAPATAVAHMLASAAGEASKQGPERLALTVLISLAQMTSPLARKLPPHMAQVSSAWLSSCQDESALLWVSLPLQLVGVQAWERYILIGGVCTDQCL